MTNIDELIDDVIEREGGYVNHPADRGGPTNWGITEAVARRQGYVGDMRALPPCHWLGYPPICGSSAIGWMVHISAFAVDYVVD